MLIPFHIIYGKYHMQISGILHVGAHECEELDAYEKVVSREKVLWIEAIPAKVEQCNKTHPGIIIEQAVVSDAVDTIKFNVSNNYASSSMLGLGTHRHHHPHIHYVDELSFECETTRLDTILAKHNNVKYNFLNLDIQGAELKALKGMESYMKNVDYVYSEVNVEHLYEGCALLEEIDEFMGNHGFKRVETVITGYKWGDALWIRI